MQVEFLFRRRGFRCGTHFVSNDNRGGLHASDNSCLPPESAAGVRLRPAQRCRAMLFLTLWIITALCTSKYVYGSVTLLPLAVKRCISQWTSLPTHCFRWLQ